MVQERGRLTLVPPATLKLDLRAVPAAPSKRLRLPAAGPPRAVQRQDDPVAAGSWWTARATAGEVTGGFSRDEILRPAKEDPRAEGGVFTRVSALLRELSAGGVDCGKILCFRDFSIMNKLSRRVAVAAARSLRSPFRCRAEIIEQVLVKVNGDIITKTELETQADRRDPRSV